MILYCNSVFYKLILSKMQVANISSKIHILYMSWFFCIRIRKQNLIPLPNLSGYSKYAIGFNQQLFLIIHSIFYTFNTFFAKNSFFWQCNKAFETGEYILSPPYISFTSPFAVRFNTLIVNKASQELNEPQSEIHASI